MALHYYICFLLRHVLFIKHDNNNHPQANSDTLRLQANGQSPSDRKEILKTWKHTANVITFLAEKNGFFLSHKRLDKESFAIRSKDATRWRPSLLGWRPSLRTEQGLIKDSHRLRHGRPTSCGPRRPWATKPGVGQCPLCRVETQGSYTAIHP